jgi:hypothetical protein
MENLDMSSVKEINQAYEEIIHGELKESYRSLKLVDLMDEMEGKYRVTAARNEEWERENKPIIALYRKISMSRTL